MILAVQITSEKCGTSVSRIQINITVGACSQREKSVMSTWLSSRVRPYLLGILDRNLAIQHDSIMGKVEANR